MKTAVSVIVPCYNVAPYVDECMSGLAEQTLGPMEIICVDDGSTDGTLELLYRWREKDNRLRVISQSNAGVSAARNAGLDAAEGKYVGFVDPDDRVDRRMFSRLLGAAEKNDADVVVCGCREFVEKDGVVVHEGGWSPDDEFYPEERVEQFRRGSAWCRCVGPVYNKLVRRSLVEEHSLRFVVGLKEGEDLAFLLMLLPFAPRLRTLSDRFYITAGNVPAPPRMDGTCCWATSAWTCWAWTGWPVSGSGTACWIPPPSSGWWTTTWNSSAGTSS